ncbi:MAG TPA: hypothetical protein VF821_30480 [Lentzea sp.]
MPRWKATTAGVEPQKEVSAQAARLLAGTSVEALLDQELPRPISAVPHADLVVAIDCVEPIKVGNACLFSKLESWVLETDATMSVTSA